MDTLIHVGLHKTGTTTVQNSLYNSKEELLKLGILYPDIFNEYPNCGHHLLPGCLIPNHKFLNTKYKNRSLDVNYYLNKIQDQIKSHNPKLLVISSEVFSEIPSAELIAKIKNDLSCDTLKLFISNRDTNSLALSKLKKEISNNTSFFDIINAYRKFIFHSKKKLNYWSLSSFEYIEKFLEQSNSQSLAEYYFGDIFNAYAPRASEVLSAQKNIDNKDKFDPCVYLFAILFNQIKKHKDFSLLKYAVVSNNLEGLITNQHLLDYLEWFVKPLDDIQFWSYKYNHNFIELNSMKVSLENQKEALFAIKLEKKIIDKILKATL
jgi:hypothetical protein